MKLFRRADLSNYFLDPNAGTGYPLFQVVGPGQSIGTVVTTPVVLPSGKLQLRTGEQVIRIWNGSTHWTSRATLDHPSNIACKTQAGTEIYLTDQRLAVISRVSGEEYLAGQFPLIAIWEIGFLWVNDERALMTASTFNLGGSESILVTLPDQTTNSVFMVAQWLAQKVAANRLENSPVALGPRDRASLQKIVESGEPSPEEYTSPSRDWTISNSLSIHDCNRFHLL